MIPYGRQSIHEEDVDAVIKTLRGNWLTTGPSISKFEEEFSKKVGVRYAVAVSSGTAGLHLACIAAGLSTDDELITTPLTFCATANCALYCGGKPVFADIKDDNSGLIDPAKISSVMTDKTKIIIPVHYAGQPCDMKEIHELAKSSGSTVIEDACHALGATYGESRIGDCKYSDMCVFSFHPVKHITTGEGGMITTNSKMLYIKLKSLRSHGIIYNPEKLVNKDVGPWHQEMQDLGYNYRITDIQCALGSSQLKRLDSMVKKRRKIAERYDLAFKENQNILPPAKENAFTNSYHLYIISLKNPEKRRALFEVLRSKDIFCQVHYLPVYLQPYYQKMGYPKGLCPNAEKQYSRMISIPIFPDLTEENQNTVIDTINSFFGN